MFCVSTNLSQQPLLPLVAPHPTAVLHHTQQLWLPRPSALVLSAVQSPAVHRLASSTAIAPASRHTLAVLPPAMLASSLPRLPLLWQLWPSHYKRLTKNGYNTAVVQVSSLHDRRARMIWTDIPQAFTVFSCLATSQASVYVSFVQDLAFSRSCIKMGGSS